MSEYVLYWSPDSANLVVRMALEEAGADYRAELIDRSRREQRSAAFLRLNPQGLLPVLVDGDVVLFETAAILLYLAERHASLATTARDADRADLYRWLFFLSNTLHAELRIRFHAERYVTDDGAVTPLLRGTASRLLEHLTLLDRQLARSGSGFLLRAGFSVCDLYLAVCCRWMVLYPVADPVPVERIAGLGHLFGLLETLEQRPAVKRACAAEWIGSPCLTAPRLPAPEVGSVLG